MFNSEEITGIWDYGFASENEQKIIKFLDKIYSIPFANSKVWEKEIFSFFSKELIVPYVILTSIEDEDNMLNNIKKVFLNKILNVRILHWDSNTCYKDLIKIKESIKTGTNLKEYLPWLIQNNFIIRKIFIKNSDKEDTRFNEFGMCIKPTCQQIIDNKTGETIGYENIYFICPDKEIDYPIKEWASKISNEWKIKLKQKFHHEKKKEKKRNPLDTKLRHEVFKRDSYKCKECGATNKEKILHADHILPVAQNGSDELSNLQTLCEDCNLAKSDKKFVGGQNENQNN